MGFSGGLLSSGSEWSLPSDHPIRGERGERGERVRGVRWVRGVEWPPGWLRETSVVFLLSNLWLPDRGLGCGEGSLKPAVLGWLRASALGRCPLGAQRPFLSGFGRSAPRQ